MKDIKYHVFGRFYDGSGKGSGFLGSYKHPSEVLDKHYCYDVLEAYVINAVGDLILYCTMTESAWNENAKWNLELEDTRE
jgi:hypothetical protein